MNTASQSGRDYLCIIMVGAGGSSYARGPDKADCIERVKRTAVSDWQTLFDLGGKEATVNVIDVTGHDKVYWDDFGIHADDDPEAKFEVEKIKVTLPSLQQAEQDDDD